MMFFPPLESEMDKDTNVFEEYLHSLEFRTAGTNTGKDGWNCLFMSLSKVKTIS